MAEKKDVQAELTEAEMVELEYKRMLTLDLAEKIREREEKRDRMKAENEKRIRDQKEEERMREHRRRVCKHRKGGRNNNFAKGSAAEYSLVTNTYPDGRVEIICTRCHSIWARPGAKLKKENRIEFNRQMKAFTEMADLPTDNMPSGSQIFLTVAA